MGALKLKKQPKTIKAPSAIDPCDLCPHSEYKDVDSRCENCKLKGRRFFEIISNGH